MVSNDYKTRSLKTIRKLQGGGKDELEVLRYDIWSVMDKEGLN
jgi:hypothetical protein